MGFITTLCVVGALLAPGTRLGLTLGVVDGSGEDGFLKSMRQQIRLGLDGGQANVKWDEFETQKGKPLADAVNAAKLMGQDYLITFATIDTVKRRLPADVATLDWDDPKLIARFEAFLRTAVGALPKEVKWVSLGNEVDSYLTNHPSEVAGYIRFLAKGGALIHQLKPGLPVGVTVSCTESMRHGDLARGLQQGMDMTVCTYYPLEEFKVMPATVVPSHFSFMTELAGSRPLLLAEIGYPASPLNGSDESKQDEFVKAVFAQLDKYGAKIPLACYFLQVDFPPSISKVFESYYGMSNPEFGAFLATLGLIDSTGKPRKAWATFCDEVQKRKPVPVDG